MDIAEHAPEAGVDVLTGYEITADDSDQRPWWAAHIDVVRVAAPVTGSPLAWRFSAPRAQPALFLPYLPGRLRARVERRVVVALAAEPGDAVVNCTGLAARELTRDDTVYPLFGQIALAGHGGFDPKVTITDNRDPDAVFYAIPRRDELVLGGCTRPYPPGVPPGSTAISPPASSPTRARSASTSARSIASAPACGRSATPCDSSATRSRHA